MLIGGELVEAASGKRFENVNPATEEVLGEVADASAEDMRRAIGAAREAFDLSDWSTDRPLRKRCLEQLQEALESEREELRDEVVAEVGTPRILTFAAQVDWPLDDALRYPAKMIDEFAFERALPDSNLMGMASRRAVRKEPMGVIGAIVPWNYPVEVTLNKIGPILATGNTVVLKPAPDTPWNATAAGASGGREDRHPAGHRQRRHLLGPSRRRGAHRFPGRRHDLVHGFDRRSGSASWRRALRRSSGSFSSSGASPP